MMTKTEAVLDLEKEPCGEDMPRTFANSDNERQTALMLDPDVWREMGSPDQITLTIEPGDRLNG